MQGEDGLQHQRTDSGQSALLAIYDVGHRTSGRTVFNTSGPTADNPPPSSLARFFASLYEHPVRPCGWHARRVSGRAVFNTSGPTADNPPPLRSPAVLHSIASPRARDRACDGEDGLQLQRTDSGQSAPLAWRRRVSLHSLCYMAVFQNPLYVCDRATELFGASGAVSRLSSFWTCGDAGVCVRGMWVRGHHPPALRA